MMLRFCFFSLTFLLSFFSSITSVFGVDYHEDYHEQLKLTPLPLSNLLASFNFRSNATFSDIQSHNFRLFPRSLGQILSHSSTKELHLRFSIGRWDAQNWGTRPWNGSKEGGTGVELWAWIEADDDRVAGDKWLTLTNALSGLTCASLNFIDGTRTTRPVMSFQPEGIYGNVTAVSDLQLLHGTLPREVVCTENLTPFLKMLPCKGKAGIASLLDGHKLFDSTWQSMAIDVKPICETGKECILQVEQTIDMVLDIERSKRPRDNPIPRPPPGHELRCNSSKSYHNDWTCFPVEYSAGQEWSISGIFGKPMAGTCPLVEPDISSVCMDVPDSRAVYVPEGVLELKDANRRSRCFKMNQDVTLEMVLPALEAGSGTEEEYLSPTRPPLYAERSLTGHGQERGGVQTMLTNPSETEEVEFVYMESLPWFMRIYAHTIQANPSDSHRGSFQGDIIQDVYYRPGLDRLRGTQLEVRMRIPPKSTVFLTYDFEKAILRYTEYPPDANRGFDVAAAVITILDKSGTKSVSNLRTTALLLNLPTPDFSMPYNVIIFTSTAIALCFGGMFNIITRRFVAADEGPEGMVKTVSAQLRARIAAFKASMAMGSKQKSL